MKLSLLVTIKHLMIFISYVVIVGVYFVFVFECECMWVAIACSVNVIF